MDEKALLQELERYKEKYRDDDKVRACLSFIKENGRESLLKTLGAGHITASGWLISEDFKKVLLVSHKKLKKLIQPGGHCEKNDSSVRMAALRELQEETELQNIMSVNDEIFYLDIHKITVGHKIHIHYDLCYLFTCDDKQQIQISDESDDIRWYDLDEIEHMDSMDRAVLKMAERTKLMAVKR